MVSSYSEELLICSACGTQYEERDPKLLTSCRICDDPRQYVPPTGQTFTTLRALRSSTFPTYTNTFTPLDEDPRLTSIYTSPKFGIGQRAILITTPAGNILWDCITYLDAATITHINAQGGLLAIVISHPHYYSTHLEWAATFLCPVYVSREDESWLCRKHGSGKDGQKFIEGAEEEAEIAGTGVKAVKLGGHFPGSLVCLFDGRLLVADTLVTTPSGVGNWRDKRRPVGMNSYAFMWSIPNFIPLSPDEMARMWAVLKKHSFKSTHGAFVGTDIFAYSIKGRVLDSMKIQCAYSGHASHALLSETWDGV